ncbi:hypothetical protein O9992_13215 [Vibrio lentus]|nr:hypothetical protein [Vibrio lentus]
MGKLGRDNSVFTISIRQRRNGEFFIDVERDNLLHQLQADIL